MFAMEIWKLDASKFARKVYAALRITCWQINTAYADIKLSAG